MNCTISNPKNIILITVTTHYNCVGGSIFNRVITEKLRSPETHFPPTTLLIIAQTSPVRKQGSLVMWPWGLLLTSHSRYGPLCQRRLRSCSTESLYFEDKSTQAANPQPFLLLFFDRQMQVQTQHAVSSLVSEKEHSGLTFSVSGYNFNYSDELQT